MSFSENMRVTRIRGHIGKTTFYSTIAIDMSGFEGCCFIAIGSSLLAASSSPHAKLQIQGSTASTGIWKTYDGYVSSTKPVTGSQNYRLLAADVYRPCTYRYLRTKLTCATSSDIRWDGILAIQYDPKVAGTTDMYDSTTIAGSTLMAMKTT